MEEKKKAKTAIPVIIIKYCYYPMRDKPNVMIIAPVMTLKE